MGRPILVFVLLLSVSAFGQVPPSRDVTAPVAARPLLIRGVVVSDDTGAPLPHARLTLLGDASSDPVYADDGGRFLAVVPETASSVRVVKAGYLPLLVNRASLQPSSDERTFRMVRSAAINGTVFDSSGFPAANARVRAQRIDEARTVVGTGAAETNDLGEFRIPSLQAGRYVVTIDGGPGGRGGRRSVPPPAGGIAPPNAGADGRGRRGRGAPSLAPDVPAVVVGVGQEAFTSLVYDAPAVEAAAAAAIDARAQAAARAGDQKVPTGSVQGRVFTPDGAPLRGAAIQLTPVGGDGARRTAISDATGRYEVTSVAAGRYQVRVSRAGYTAVDFGQTRAQQAGRIVSVSEGQRVSRIDVTMPRTSAIAGTIVDAWSEPIEGLLVQVWQSRFADGRTTLANVGVPQRTDDRGRYRVHGLLPGSYVVVAIEEAPGGRGGRAGGRGQPGPGGGPGSRTPAGPRVFYPGVLTPAEAAPLVVDVAQDVLGADFSYAPGRAATVRGLARNSRGEPVRGRATLATSYRSRLLAFPTQSVDVGADGTFEFANVPAGDYVVQVLEGSGLGRGGRNPGFAGGGRGAFVAGGGNRGGDPAAAGGRGGTAPVNGAPASGRQGAQAQGPDSGQSARGGRAGQPGQNGPAGQAGQAGGRAGQFRASQVAGVPREFGVEFVAVGEGGLYSLTIDTAPGSTVSGEVVLEGDGTGLTSTTFAFAAYPADPDSSPGAGQREWRATVREDWSFEMADVVGLVRFGLLRAPDGWWLKSVTIGGVNGVDDPVSFGRGLDPGRVRAVFASGAGEISGRVTNDQRQAATDFAVAVFSTDPARWFPQSPYVQLAAGSQDGSFRAARLPPGEYYVVAVDGLAGNATYGDWQNPDVLQALAPAARRVMLKEGQQATADLRVNRTR